MCTNKIIFSFVLASMLIIGCGPMNESECRNPEQFGYSKETFLLKFPKCQKYYSEEELKFLDDYYWDPGNAFEVGEYRYKYEHEKDD